jgi:hypothetical protein
MKAKHLLKGFGPQKLRLRVDLRRASSCTLTKLGPGGTQRK